jgi:hypothetical protein
MFLESVNGPFSGVAPMAVRGNKLILHIICGEQTLQSLVVQGLKFGFETFGSEFLVNVFICFDPFRGGPLFHRHNFDLVAVIRVAYNNVPVEFNGSYQKFPFEI